MNDSADVSSVRALHVGAGLSPDRLWALLADDVEWFALGSPDLLPWAGPVITATSVGMPCSAKEPPEGADGLVIGLEGRRRDVRCPKVANERHRVGGEMAGYDKIGSAGGRLAHRIILMCRRDMGRIQLFERCASTAFAGIASYPL